MQGNQKEIIEMDDELTLSQLVNVDTDDSIYVKDLRRDLKQGLSQLMQTI
jgi:hypothetical protein